MRDLEDGGTSDAEMEMLFNGVEESGRTRKGKANGRGERDGLLDVDGKLLYSGVEAVGDD